jgi:hypothetical protein
MSAWVGAGATEVIVNLTFVGIIRGRVIGDEGTPERFAVNREWLSGTRGRFELTRGPETALVLDISAEGYLPLRRTFQLPPRGSFDVGDLRLSSGAELHGTVIDAEGEPLGGVSVSCVASGADVAAVSDADGNFACAHLPDGRVSLHASGDGWRPLTVSVEAPWSGVVVRMRRGLRLIGQVIDERGRAVRHRSLEYDGVAANGGGTLETDDDGRFALTQLSSGELDFHAVDESSGYIPAVHLTLTETDPPPLTVHAYRGGAELRVHFGEPEPQRIELYDGVVGVDGVRDDGRFPDVLEESGDFRWRFVSQGHHTLILVEQDGTSRAEPVEVSGSGTVELTLSTQLGTSRRTPQLPLPALAE